MRRTDATGNFLDADELMPDETPPSQMGPVPDLQSEGDGPQTATISAFPPDLTTAPTATGGFADDGVHSPITGAGNLNGSKTF